MNPSWNDDMRVTIAKQIKAWSISDLFIDIHRILAISRWRCGVQYAMMATPAEDRAAGALDDNEIRQERSKEAWYSGYTPEMVECGRWHFSEALQFDSFT